MKLLSKPESVMSIYSDKLAHEQVVINCQYSVAQRCTCEDNLTHYLGAPFFDDVMRYNTLMTVNNIEMFIQCNLACFSLQII